MVQLFFVQVHICFRLPPRAGVAVRSAFTSTFTFALHFGWCFIFAPLALPRVILVLLLCSESFLHPPPACLPAASPVSAHEYRPPRRMRLYFMHSVPAFRAVVLTTNLLFDLLIVGDAVS